MIVWSARGVLESDWPAAAATIRVELAGTDPFVVWLDGGMGAGKTAAVRALLRAFGLPVEIPVTSPTYTLMNEYEIGSEWFAHLDLYRAAPGFSLRETGVLDARVFRGVFIEWADAPDAGERLDPTHRLHLEISGDGERDVALTRL